MRRALTLAWLTVVWVTLWEDVSWANVIGGIIVATAVMLLVSFRTTRPGLGFRPLHAVRLLFYFLWELIKASVFLSWEIVTPPNTINAGIVSVPLTSREPGIVVSVANMVSLVPGTITLEVDEETMTLFIHVLHLKSKEETGESVHTLERLTLAAFPPRAASPQITDRGLT
jgi:multicomponent Na+:H+ antiporter subunit E